MRMNDTDLLYRSVIVAAHPDDEVLWFSSILQKVDEILLCFSDYHAKPAWGMGRKKSLSEYPVKNISCLEIDESGAFDSADWNSPVITEFGLKLYKNRSADKKYRENYGVLKEYLRGRLSGFRNVITHTPWGDYGHEEHVQVFRAVKALQGEMNFNVWFSNYCGSRSFKLMLRYIAGFDSEYVTLKTDKKLAEGIKDLYKKNGCWTWYDNWEWFNEESFMKDKGYDKIAMKYGHIFPLNLIKWEISKAPEKKPNFFSRRILNLKRQKSRKGA
jgi:LmbE family N-acetylglucosaminyl deacetylase